MNATCTNCSTTFRGVDRDEDGRADVPAVKCADPTCETWLCFGACEHLSFVCASCNARFCNEHAILIPDGEPRPMKVCPTCAACCEEDTPRRPIEMARPAVASGAVA